MKFKKADRTLAKKAEKDGLMVGMTGIIGRKRTALNNELSDYFREKMPDFFGSFCEDKGEDILRNINSYLEKSNIDKHPLDFPIRSGSDIHLIPITENLKLEVLVTDEYFRDGDYYSKYVTIDFFLINDNATKQDVDKLINFAKKYLA